MENKKSFILHLDSLEILNELTDEQSGKLFKAIFKYQKGEKIELNQIIKIAFIPFKNQIDRDKEKWEAVRIARSEAGKKGGRPKKQTKAKKANALFEKQTKAKKAVSVSVNVNGNVNVNDNKNVNKNKKFSFKDFKNLEEKNLNLLLEKISEKKEVPINLLQTETTKFINYWSETSASGKERWQGEKFFDVDKRLTTWIANALKWEKKDKPKIYSI